MLQKILLERNVHVLNTKAVVQHKSVFSFH